jgi:hypothetical protein
LGEGVFLTKDAQKGDIVFVTGIEDYDCPNSVHASQVSIDKWILFSKMGRTINHSCSPNTGVGYDGLNWYFRALRDIKAGEEITYDYDMMNYVVDNFPHCLCKSAGCRGEIKGYRTLPL